MSTPSATEAEPPPRGNWARTAMQDTKVLVMANVKPEYASSFSPPSWISQLVLWTSFSTHPTSHPKKSKEETTHLQEALQTPPMEPKTTGIHRTPGTALPRLLTITKLAAPNGTWQREGSSHPSRSPDKPEWKEGLNRRPCSLPRWSPGTTSSSPRPTPPSASSSWLGSRAYCQRTRMTGLKS